MIWESHPWKVDLYKRAEWLKTKKSQRRWPASACARVEQCVMIGCYCIRKLIEAKKLTDAVVKRQVPLVVYKVRGKPVHAMNWHNLNTLYELERGAKRTKQLTFICNQLIHSYVYTNGFSDEGGLDFVMFCSDFERNTNLFRISIDDLAEVFTVVAKDEVDAACTIWNKKNMDYDGIRASSVMLQQGESYADQIKKLMKKNGYCV